MNLKSKLCLGTVQFGLIYGINNTLGIPSNEDIQKIFILATKSGIRILDTALGYGNAEKKIGELGKQQFKIVTKFSTVKHPDELNNLLEQSLRNLKINSLYGYLAHNADTLIANPNLWQTLLKAKEKRLVKKIGYSIYSCEQLEKLLTLNLIPDIVQLPYSLLDRKFGPYLSQLKKLGVEIHVRSVFLQGLYFVNPSALPNKLKSLKINLEELHQCCNTFNISIGSLALNFVITNPNIDKVVIGIESPFQLQQNLDMIQAWQYNQNLINYVSKIEVVNKNLLNPVNW